MSKDNIVEDVLNEWESKYGLHTKHINVSTTTEIMDKLSNHEIDCFVSVEESRWEESDISPLTSIGETEIYFAINPERPDIKKHWIVLCAESRMTTHFTQMISTGVIFLHRAARFFQKKKVEWIGQHGAIRIGVSESGWRYQQCRSINRQTDRCYHRLCGSCRKLSARSDSGI